jgi:hypothetical protein
VPDAAYMYIPVWRQQEKSFMQKTVTFIDREIERMPTTHDLRGWFKFSVIDSCLMGTPRERGSIHIVEVGITEELLDSWGLAGSLEAVVTSDMEKVAFQSAEDYIAEQLNKGPLPEGKLPPLFLSTKTSSTSCPYKLPNILYPAKTVFKVDIDELVSQPLGRCLEDFTCYIQAEMRMTFWESDKTKRKKEYKWIPHPEQRAKDLLRTHLNGRFGDRLYTFEEIRSGAGVIDVFIISPVGEKIVVELKMCGHGYSQTWAQSGIRQVAHYMENKNTKVGYLLVFDSRVREFSHGFQSAEITNGVPVTTTVVDLRPYVKQEDAPNTV